MCACMRLASEIVHVGRFVKNRHMPGWAHVCMYADHEGSDSTFSSSARGMVVTLFRNIYEGRTYT
jgi:hypothetical protein